MKVNKIKPQGYCKGVILAINKCLEVINNPNTIKPIYLLGMIIHNRFVCDELEYTLTNTFDFKLNIRNVGFGELYKEKTLFIILKKLV